YIKYTTCIRPHANNVICGQELLAGATKLQRFDGGPTQTRVFSERGPNQSLVRQFLTLSSFRRVRFAEDSCFDVLRLSVVRLLISVAICFAIGLFVLVQVAIVI